MTDICERGIVRWPERDASHFLAAFVARHRGNPGSMRLALRLPLTMFSAWCVPIERRGVASFYSLQSVDDRHSTYSVTWSADGGIPVPEFAGALAVERLADSGSFGLILTGHYEPPLGKVGAIFDAVLGRRMAQGFAQDLLRSIAAHVKRLPTGIGTANESDGARTLAGVGGAPQTASLPS